MEKWSGLSWTHALQRLPGGLLSEGRGCARRCSMGTRDAIAQPRSTRRTRRSTHRTRRVIELRNSSVNFKSTRARHVSCARPTHSVTDALGGSFIRTRSTSAVCRGGAFSRRAARVHARSERRGGAIGSLHAPSGRGNAGKRDGALAGGRRRADRGLPPPRAARGKGYSFAARGLSRAARGFSVRVVAPAHGQHGGSRARGPHALSRPRSSPSAQAATWWCPHKMVAERSRRTCPLDAVRARRHASRRRAIACLARAPRVSVLRASR